MLANRLRHRVHLQRPVHQQDPVTGLNSVSWVTATANGVAMDAVPAEVLLGPGRELMAAGAKQAEVSARINLRWFPGLSPDWRLLWDGRVFNILGYSSDVTGRREWRLQCVDGPSDGR